MIVLACLGLAAGVACLGLGAWLESRNQDRTTGEPAGRTRTGG